MWGRRVLSLLQKAAKGSNSRLSLGAAVSLVALTEIDRQTKRGKELQLPCSPILSATLCEGDFPMDARSRRVSQLRKRQTLRIMDNKSTKESLTSRYDVQWKTSLGEGSFGTVFLATDRRSGEKLAVKKISKRYTNDNEFYREMNALLHLQRAGGHPNICSLREHFSEGGYYYLILDLVSGGEMFDHLVDQGAYSEADAARLVREVGAALAFIHGLNTTHCDLKPENLMLSTRNPSDAVIKLVDFGCAQVTEDMDETDVDEVTEKPGAGSLGARTLAYCPPEVLLKKQSKMDPSMDMWALGVIIYIMLTGIHPYDLTGGAPDEVVAKEITSGKPPPLRNSPFTAHLSESAIELIEKLMCRDKEKRMTAHQMLEDPWVKGVTASQSKMVDSDKKLSMYRVYKSGIQAKVFADIVTWSDMQDSDDVAKRASLIERSFRVFDKQQKGYITKKDLHTIAAKIADSSGGEADDQEAAPLSLSGFSDLLAENMKNKYFPKGHIVYRQGDEGHEMYFINSGRITVESSGSRVQRGPGDFFGEGALLHPEKIRSATIHCETPVHAIAISREYFEKYIAKSDSGLLLTLREKDKIRKRNRAKMILRLQKNLKERSYEEGDHLYDVGDDGDSLFIVQSGMVDVTAGKNHVFTATPGNVCGEFSVITGLPRNTTATCSSERGCLVQEMMGRDFRKLSDVSPDIKTSLRDLSLRRDFKKAVVLRLKKEFPYDNPREAFDAVKKDSDQYLSVDAIGVLMRELNPDYTDEEIQEIMKTLDLMNSGAVSFDEFKKVFIADIRTSASI